MAKKYRVCLRNDSCIFDSATGFDTVEGALEWSLGRGGSYTVLIGVSGRLGMASLVVNDSTIAWGDSVPEGYPDKPKDIAQAARFVREEIDDTVGDDSSTKYAGMTIAELVKALRIERVGDKLRCWGIPKTEEKETLAYLKANKPAIMQYLLEREAAKERARIERENKIKAIPGLAEIESAQADLAAWHDEWDASFEGPDACGGLGVRPRPEYDFKALNQRYPRAAAYIKSRAYSRAAHHAKSSAGAAAVEKILDGEDYTAAINEMETAWKQYCDDHIWD